MGKCTISACLLAILEIAPHPLLLSCLSELGSTNGTNWFLRSVSSLAMPENTKRIVGGSLEEVFNVACLGLNGGKDYGVSGRVCAWLFDGEANEAPLLLPICYFLLLTNSFCRTPYLQC